MRNRIDIIKNLFENIRDTLSRDEVNDIRLNIHKNVKLYDHYTSKKRLNKKQKAVSNEAIDNLNNLYEYLLSKNKAKGDDNVSYDLDKLFDYNEQTRLIKKSFKGNYVYFRSRGDKNSSIKEHLEKIIYKNYLLGFIYKN